MYTFNITRPFSFSEFPFIQMITIWCFIRKSRKAYFSGAFLLDLLFYLSSMFNNYLISVISEHLIATIHPFNQGIHPPSDIDDHLTLNLSTNFTPKSFPSVPNITSRPPTKDRPDVSLTIRQPALHYWYCI